MASLADGRYHAMLKGGVVSTAKTAGSTQMVLSFALSHRWDEDRGDWVAVPGGTDRSVYLSFAGKAKQYTIKKLQSLGFNFDAKAPQFADGPQMEGVDLLASTEDNGKGESRQSFDLADWGGSEVQPASDGVLAQLNAEWQALGLHGKTPAATGQPATPVPAAAPAPAAPEPAPAAPPAPDAEPVATTVEVPKVATKAEAWKFFCSRSAGAPDQEQWKQIVLNVGKPESEFTADDWQDVAVSAAIPF